MCYYLRITKRIGTEGNNAVNTLLQVGLRDKIELELGDKIELELGDKTLVEIDNESAYSSNNRLEEELESELVDKRQDRVRREVEEEAIIIELISNRSGDILYNAIRLFQQNKE